MIEFACPGCTKVHEANRAFAGFEARCLRCGMRMTIPARSGLVPAVIAAGPAPKPAAERAAPAPPVATGGRQPAPRPAAEIDTDLEDRSPVPPPPAKNPLVATGGRERPRTPPAVFPDPLADDRGGPDPAAAGRKRMTYIVGGSVAAAVVIALLIAFAFKGDPPKPDLPSPPPPPPRREEPKPEPTAPAPVLREPAPMPRPVRPPVEYEPTAAGLLLEYADDPAGCDRKYAGKELLVRGVFHQYKLGKLTLAAAPDPTAPGLTATLTLPAPAGPGTPLLADPGLTPGQPVAVRGRYELGCRLAECTVAHADAPADAAFLGKSVWLDGAVVRSVSPPTGPAPFPAVVLEPPVTDAKITVTCYFKPSDRDEVARLRPGARVNVRGRCSGRTYTGVRLDNCGVVPPTGEPPADGVRVPADRFFFAYEADLLPAPRPGPAAELLPVTAEGLASAFQIDPRAANAAYRFKPVQLSGTVLQRRADTRMLVLEAGTDTRYQVAVVFSPAAFSAIPPEDRTVVVRGTCSGLWNGSFVRVDGGEFCETEPGAVRTDPGFLPFRPGVEYLVDHLTFGPRKDHPIARLAVRFTGGDRIQVTTVRTGTFAGKSLFQDSPPGPRWGAPARNPVSQARNYRVQDGVVEIGYVAPTRDQKGAQLFWEPVLKTGLKKGQSWSARFPDGKLATYTVANISKDAAGRDRLEIKRVLRDPTDAGRWEEAEVVYVRGVGEVRRVTVGRTGAGEAVVLSESRLVGDGSGSAELKTDRKKAPN